MPRGRFKANGEGSRRARPGSGDHGRCPVVTLKRRLRGGHKATGLGKADPGRWPVEREEQVG